jgi:hypothetical protein
MTITVIQNLMRMNVSCNLAAPTAYNITRRR